MSLVTHVTFCKNCASPLSGPYCSQCGQKDPFERPSIRHFLGEFIEALTQADSRLWRTLWMLLRYPGQLAKRYRDGERARFLPPIRTYLLISVGFFVLLSIDNQVNTKPVEPLIGVEQKDTAREQTDKPCDITYTGPYKEALLPKIQQACERAMQDGGQSLSERFNANLPSAMFVLMPLFSGVIVLLYWRPRRYFVDHLTLQILNHSALFLAAAIVQLLQWLAPEGLRGVLDLLLVPYALTYCARSLFVFYGQSRWLTLAKFTILMFVYFLLVGFVMFFTGIASIL